MATEQKPQKQHLVLPNEVKNAFTAIQGKHLRNAYIRSLRILGWTYESIAKASGITRERIRQIARAEQDLSLAKSLPLPNLPMKEVVVRNKPVYIEPTPETLARLLELQPFAQQVRANDPKYRKEAEEYTYLVNYAHTVENVTLYRLAKRLGITHGALRFRLARYGYKLPANGTSKVYDAILDKNRVNL